MKQRVEILTLYVPKVTFWPTVFMSQEGANTFK
jgi:hypothetical protein